MTMKEVCASFQFCCSGYSDSDFLKSTKFVYPHNASEHKSRRSLARGSACTLCHKNCPSSDLKSGPSPHAPTSFVQSPKTGARYLVCCFGLGSAALTRLDIRRETANIKPKNQGPLFSPLEIGRRTGDTGSHVYTTLINV